MLCGAWRSAWGTLLRADLRFSNPTVRCQRDGVGEAVVAVLGACMREKLLEPGFVTKEQVRGGGGHDCSVCWVFVSRGRLALSQGRRFRRTNTTAAVSKVWLMILGVGLGSSPES